MHDWFSHGQNEAEKPWQIELAADDPWTQHPMEIQRTRRDPSADADGPPTFVTADTHWWDGSQIYGNEPAFARALRTGENGKLKLDDRGLIPQEVEAHVDLTGVAGNFWVGLALLHSLFMREHNAICDHLHATHPEKIRRRALRQARLVVAALMAKIHTVDWTPAIIAHPTTVKALRANWWGLGASARQDGFGRHHRERGDPRHPGDEDGPPRRPVPADRGVRRRLPHAPADPRRLRLPRARRRRAAPAVHVARTSRRSTCAERLTEMSLADVIYSFGDDYPGALTLHNYPRYLQDFHRADGEHIDLASIDVLRIRERGVPRYNDFRRLFHLEGVRQLRGDDATHRSSRGPAPRLRGCRKRVDLMVGIYAEPKPKGFGFSDTAFRIFILMASRRLESRPLLHGRLPARGLHEGGDRLGRGQPMRSLLLRHFPELEPALEGVANPFAPWKAHGAARDVIEIAPGIHSLGHGKGGHVHAFLSTPAASSRSSTRSSRATPGSSSTRSDSSGGSPAT